MTFKNVIKDLFLYKQPSEVEQFELLEDDKEDSIDSASYVKSDDLNQNQSQSSQKEQSVNPHEKRVDKNIKVNREHLKYQLNAPANQDVVIREFKIMGLMDAFVIYIDGMTEKTTLNDDTLKQLMKKREDEEAFTSNAIGYIVNNLLSINQISIESDYEKVIKEILNGCTALFIDNNDQCILIESRGFERRTVSQPVTETVIGGPQEAFVENLRTNITLIRRIIRNKNLISEIMHVGKENHMNYALMYINGITDMRIVDEVKKRVSSLDIDYISSNGALNQLIEDHPFALFPQILTTERPDRAASLLMEGKVVILCDGSPFANVVPITLFHLLNTSEDYNLRWQYGTFLRIVRLIAAFFGLFLPGLYIALTLYHQEMIPTELLTSLARSREALPFPIVVEMIVMEISWELIREAGVRVPGVIGQTIGIIGAVILGQAAVAAGLVSPVLIIITAITGLCSFAIPAYNLAFAHRILRFAFIFLGAIAGFYGIAVGTFIFGGLICSMKSFGVPYVSPIAPKTKPNHDAVIRQPLWAQKERPDFLNTHDRSKTGKTVRGWKDQNSKGNKQ